MEPDGLPAARQCTRGRNLRDRLAAIRYATLQFARLPNTGVYIDAGTSDWRPAGEMAHLLELAGVGHVRGFSLNVTHYDWTANQIRYGDRIARATHKHFVVNTAYNGLGPIYKNGTGSHGEKWCNPPGRALGPLPTTNTGDSRADAFFWIGGPGTSDNCGRGHKRAGVFDPRWAAELIDNALHRRGAEYPYYRGHLGAR